MKTPEELVKELVGEWNEGFGTLEEEIELIKKAIRQRDAEWVNKCQQVIDRHFLCKGNVCLLNKETIVQCDFMIRKELSSERERQCDINGGNKNESRRG